uniref:Uncharacterized protein n=1 Tax=Arundo donax TaxID=35708 RepID=A0A0A9FEK6_ARUDO
MPVEWATLSHFVSMFQFKFNAQKCTSKSFLTINLLYISKSYQNSTNVVIALLTELASYLATNSSYTLSFII